MANTTNIHIRKSTTTAIPPTGNLEIGELAYSYVSNTMFIGGSDELGILPIGGYSQVVKLNAAFDAANAAYDAANAVYTFSANTVELIANSAYAKANAANILADATYTYAANAVMLAANSAYAKANAANTIAEASFIQANSANIIALAAFDKANTGTSGGAAFDAANAAFAQANMSNTIAIAAFEKANTGTSGGAAFDSANAAYDKANAANLLASTTYTYAANNVMLAANSAYSAQNTTYGYAANVVMSAANSAYSAQNTTYGYAANQVMSAANAAFAMANAANLMPVGNTASNGYFSIRSTKRQLNFIPGSLIAINVADDATLNTANVTIDATLADPQYAFAKANLAYTYAANNAMSAANAAFAKANAANITADATYTFAANNVRLIANAAYAAQNTTYTFAANTVRLIANSAYAAQNSTYTYAANVVMSAANAAFSRANGANIVPVGNTMANGYFTVRSSKRQLNFKEGTNVTITVDDDATLNTANITINAATGSDPLAPLAYAKANAAYTFAANDAMLAANSAYAAANSNYTYSANTVMSAANAAFAKANAANVTADATYTYAANNVMLVANAAFAMANAANLMPVGNTIGSNGYFTVRATRRKINFLEGTNITITVDDDPTLNTANITINASAGSDPLAPLAYTKANAAYTFAANDAMLAANSAYAKANAANITADSTYTFAANNVMLAANSAYAAQNSTYTYAANNVMLAANSAYTAQNATYTYAANSVMSASNAAFAMANAANLMPVGNTMANGYWTVRSTKRNLNFIPGSLITINVNDDATLNTANIIIDATSADPQYAFLKANLAYTYAANNAMLAANSAYDKANAANITADSTYTYAANVVMIAANSAYAKANAANITADSTYTFAANTVRLIANSAYAAANSNYTYAANIVMSAANAAFSQANAANLMPVGNTMSNNYWTIRSTRRRINFIPGSLITINVNDDASLNTANVIIDATAADPQYAFAKANLAYTYAANDAMSAANSAYAKANAANITADSTYTFAANTVRLIANSAYAAQNSTYTYAANNVMLAANSAYAAQNSTYTYAANVVMSAANAAFTMANAANLMPVGNTMANGYFSIRSTKRQLNFIPGSLITVNVNDDAALNTANIIIDATAANPQYAFAKANLAYTYAANDAMLVANSAYAAGNSTYTYAANNVMLAANSAYAAQNSTYTYAANVVMSAANSAYAKANAANITADTTYTFAANTVRLIANSAYAAQNTTYGYASNQVMSAANAAFAMANAANLMPIGNTIGANSYFTVRSTRRRLNFVEGTNVTITVDDDPTLNTANITINAAAGSDPIAGLAYTKANAAYTYAANDAMLAANSAYAKANAANATADSNYTYASNVVMSAANAAFSQANGANIIPVGNTISNGYFSVRSSKRRLNFIEGSNITINVDDDATLNTANITITSTASGGDPQYAFAKANLAYTYAANDAMLAANSAYAKANAANITADSTYTYAANNVMSAANAAFAMANAANLMPVGNTMANGYWTVRSTKRQINFIPGSLITINVNDDATLNTANVIIDAMAADPQYAFLKANLAYTYAANNAMSAANSAYAAQNTTYTYAANNVMLAANNAYAAQNTTYGYAANQVMSAANAAFAMANAANLMPIGNTIFSNNYHTVRATRRKINFIPGADHVTINVNDDATINAANVIISTTEFGASYALANATWTYAANNVMLAANSAYAAQNSTYTFAANTVRLIANSAYAAQNSTYTYAANNVMLVANAAFAMANAANLMPVGNTMANGYWTTRSTRRRINFIPGSNITINVDDDPTLNTANVTITSTASGGDPTDAFIKANLAYTYAANNAMLAANSAYAAGNTTWTYAANNVMLAANSAYAAQNSTYTYAANQVMSAANAAFAMANAANLMPVGNTMSNSYFTVRATRRRINFIEGSNITINVDDDPTLNTSNITITASLTGGDPSFAFDRANIANLQPVGNTMSNGYFTVRSTANKLNFIPDAGITINVDQNSTLNTSNITVAANLTVRSANIVNVTVSATAPTNNVAGDIWIDIS